MNRCAWVGKDNPLYESYHDNEWGVPVHDDGLFFEMLILEGAQAGLSWETILKRRNAFQKAFNHFNPQFVAMMSDESLENLCNDASIIRNRKKIYSARTNAKAFCAIQREFGSFDRYVWSFVNGTPKINLPKTFKEVQSQSVESNRLSKDLKIRGMSFVGPTIIYAFMQATGLVNDHTEDCDWSVVSEVDA